MSDELWTFNGLDGATGEYLLQTTPEALSAVALGEPPDPKFLSELKMRHDAAAKGHFGVSTGIDVNRLDQTGWAVIFPAVADDTPEAANQREILAALRPLLDHRKAQATATDARFYKEYIGALGLRPNESKLKFLSRQGGVPGPADPTRVPYYLLLVGDPVTIPFRVQSQMEVQHAVGRLWFPTVEEYAHYARSVVEAETRELRLARRLAFFGTNTADDPATIASSSRLITPVANVLASDPRVPGWQIERTLGEPATRQALSDLLHHDAPALLFTASHGMGLPIGDPRQLPHQGALVCQDWPGPRNWRGPIPEQFYFAGDQLASSADLHGTIAFLFACYGAGTPEFDEFSKQRRDSGRPAAIAPHPFLAKLPTAMLGRPNGGALAVVGHIERAWGQSFMWANSNQNTSQTLVFESALRGLMMGMPIGAAMEVFGQRYGELSSELTIRLEDASNGIEVPAPELAHLWTSNNDARGYAILGDPAVRVSVGDGPVTGRRATSAMTTTTATITSITTTTTSETPAPQNPAPDLQFGLFGGSSKDSPDPEEPGGGVLGTLKGFVGKLGETITTALEDMANLEVRTYSIDANIITDIAVEGNKIEGGRLRAYTRISLDGDTIICVPERDGEIDRELLDIHQAMVKQAQAARNELMQTIVHAASSLFGLSK